MSESLNILKDAKDPEILAKIDALAAEVEAKKSTSSEEK